MWQFITTALGILAALGLSAHLAVRFLDASRRRRDAPDMLYEPVKDLLDDPRYEKDASLGYPQLVGTYHNLPVRIHGVVDTLAVRKLPVLWLLVTIPLPLPVKSTFDLMMRPAGPTTFSNYDLLPHAIQQPPGFPEDGGLRTDDPDHLVPAFVVEPHLDLFKDRRAKELLISQKGVRIVWQIAQADRIRYGVFRQAEFGDVALDPDIVRRILDRLIALRHAIIDWKERAP